jgi:GNAT superfamily N-acetyltransferase
VTRVAREVTVTYLAMDHRPELPALPHPELILHRHDLSDAAREAERLYRAVGAEWHWTDRLTWMPAAWDVAMNQPGVELWTASVAGRLVGYFQLHASPANVEIKYLGLLPDAIGRGWGRALLDAAIARAWQLGGPRVTLNTCSLDHPAALPNYRARGFQVERVETGQRMIDA